MTTRNVIDVIAITLVAAVIIILSARAQPDSLIKPTWNGGPPEPYLKPKQFSPTYIEWLRSKNHLPPEEFDHEYKGQLTVIRGTQDDLRAACAGAFKPGYSAIGCAKRRFDGAFFDADACTVYIVNDAALRSLNWDYEVVLRHERAHCNGWHHEPPSGIKCWANSCD